MTTTEAGNPALRERAHGKDNIQAPDSETSPDAPATTDCLAALGGNPGAQLMRLRNHLEFQRQDVFQKMRINWSTSIDRKQSRRHITNHLHAKINLKVPNFYQPGKSNTEEALQNMDKMTFMARSKGRIEAKMGVDRHLSWTTRYRIFRQRYPNLPEDLFWEMMREDYHRTIAPKINGFPREIQEKMFQKEQDRKDLKEYNRRLRELISLQGGNPDEYKKAVIRVMKYCYSCAQLHPAEKDGYQRCPDCRNQLGQEREFASPAGEWPSISPVQNPAGNPGTDISKPTSRNRHHIPAGQHEERSVPGAGNQAAPRAERRV